jgi:pimeloyl-ACP methyl ester carboxylesterase
VTGVQTCALPICSDGRLRYRYCRPAVASLYGELASAPPPPERLTVPTLVLYAPDFGLVRERQIAAYRTALDDLLEVVEVGGGHVVYWDAYEETADAVDEFLA